MNTCKNFTELDWIANLNCLNLLHFFTDCIDLIANNLLNTTFAENWDEYTHHWLPTSNDGLDQETIFYLIKIIWIQSSVKCCESINLNEVSTQNSHNYNYSLSNVICIDTTLSFNLITSLEFSWIDVCQPVLLFLFTCYFISFAQHFTRF